MTMTMKLACSNIAWTDAQEAAVLPWLQAQGVGGIEVAPTRLWPNWHGATPAGAREWRKRMADQGFSLPSMQALLFGKADACLFGADGGNAFVEHLEFVAELGEGLGAGVAVLGAPRQRLRGDLPMAEAVDLAIPLLRRLAQTFHDAGSCLALEPARPEYGGDFCITTAEVSQLVAAVDHPGLGVHIDAAALFAAEESIEDLWEESRGQRWVHYQMSEPELGGFSAPCAPQLANLRFLRSVDWPHWCAIEMRVPPMGVIEEGPWAILREARAG
tara:strand:+ start:5393 stop:6211 length:819 start_codon:yes stop_codon:yes gene_type:complete